MAHNPTYKHLEQKVRIGPLSLWQWAQLFASLCAAIGFGIYLSPLPPKLTIGVSALLAGLPIAVSYGAMGLEFSVGRFAGACWRWARRPQRYLAGPGAATPGYLVTPDPTVERQRPAAQARAEERGLSELWDA